jgi:hypothetical protein cdivTM_06047
MRKVKILFLMLLGVFGLNSCLALGIATALGVALPYTAAISCTEFQKMCDIDNPKPKTPEQIEKENKAREKTKEINRILMSDYKEDNEISDTQTTYN